MPNKVDGEPPLGSTVHTDEFGTYREPDRAGHTHEAFRQQPGRHVNGNSYINSLDGFWASLKRRFAGLTITCRTSTCRSM